MTNTMHDEIMNGYETSLELELEKHGETLQFGLNLKNSDLSIVKSQPFHHALDQRCHLHINSAGIAPH